MNGKGIAIALALGAGMLAMGGGRSGGRAAAARRLRAADAAARRPDFVPSRETPQLTGDTVRSAGTAPSADPRRARQMAAGLNRALRAAQPGPIARQDVQAFQLAAGLPGTGLYDARTAAALRRVGIRNAPPPWFVDDDEPQETAS